MGIDNKKPRAKPDGARGGSSGYRAHIKALWSYQQLKHAAFMTALYCDHNIAKETINKVPSTKPATCLIEFM